MQSDFSWAPKPARKCKSKHWFACGADGRSFVSSVYDHVITKFSGMGRLPELWGSAHVRAKRARGAPLLYSSQYGFRSKHSTQHATLEILNDILSNFEKARPIHFLFIY